MSDDPANLLHTQRINFRQTDRQTHIPTVANTGLCIASYADTCKNLLQQSLLGNSSPLGQRKNVKFYILATVSQTRVQKHFTVSELAADFYELMDLSLPEMN